MFVVPFYSVKNYNLLPHVLLAVVSYYFVDLLGHYCYYQL